jgi:hypothetical protein
MRCSDNLKLGQWRKLFTVLEFISIQSLNKFGPWEGVEFELQIWKVFEYWKNRLEYLKGLNGPGPLQPSGPCEQHRAQLHLEMTHSQNSPTSHMPRVKPTAPSSPSLCQATAPQNRPMPPTLILCAARTSRKQSPVLSPPCEGSRQVHAALLLVRLYSSPFTADASRLRPPSGPVPTSPSSAITPRWSMTHQQGSATPV